MLYVKIARVSRALNKQLSRMKIIFVIQTGVTIIIIKNKVFYPFMFTILTSHKDNPLPKRNYHCRSS